MQTRSEAISVALLIESDGPGGAESVILTLADGLRRQGVRVLPVVFAGGPRWLSNQLKDAGFPVFMPRLRRAIDPYFVLELARWLRAQRVQLVHAHEFTMGFYAGVASKLVGIPHVITMHGGRNFATARRRRYALRYSAARASRVIGVAEDTCVHLADALRLPRESIQLVPNGVRVTTGDRSRIRAELQLAPDARLLLAVGNLYKVKGHRTLIEALALVRDTPGVPDWTLLIAGRGEEHDALQAQIRVARLHDRVHLLGLRQDIPDLLAAADGWVMSSESEGLPMALLEAMLAGLPVVCTAVGGIPSLVRPEESGWLVPSGSPEPLSAAIIELLTSAEKAKAFGARGRAIVETDYGQERLVARHLEIYRSSLK